MSDNREEITMDMNGNMNGSEFRANAGLITWELRLPGAIPAEVWPVLRRLQAAACKASVAIDAAIETARADEVTAEQ